MRVKHRPQRTCIVCRGKHDKRDLTRLVMLDGRVQVDHGGKMNGRGAYLCANRQCWQSIKRATLSRALRQDLTDDDLALLRQMTPS